MSASNSKGEASPRRTFTEEFKKGSGAARHRARQRLGGRPRPQRLRERHALPAGERIGLVVFSDAPDKPHFWQPIDRDILESLIGESLDEGMASQEIRWVPDSQEWQPDRMERALAALAT